MYRGLMADRLNISVRTVRTYEKDLGFSNEANYRERQITWDNWYRLPRYKQQFSLEGERLPSKQWLKIVDWRTGTVILKPHVRYLAYTALKEGLEVYQVERLANTYYPYDRPAQDGVDPIDFYYANMAALQQAGFVQQNDGQWFYQRE